MYELYLNQSELVLSRLTHLSISLKKRKKNPLPVVTVQDGESPGKEMYGSKQFLHIYNLELQDLFQVSMRNTANSIIIIKHNQ